jgi:hypothetical protein
MCSQSSLFPSECTFIPFSSSAVRHRCDLGRFTLTGERKSEPRHRPTVKFTRARNSPRFSIMGPGFLIREASRGHERTRRNEGRALVTMYHIPPYSSLTSKVTTDEPAGVSIMGSPQIATRKRSLPLPKCPHALRISTSQRSGTQISRSSEGVYRF